MNQQTNFSAHDDEAYSTESQLQANWWENICPCEDLTPHSVDQCKRRRPGRSSSGADKTKGSSKIQSSSSSQSPKTHRSTSTSSTTPKAPSARTHKDEEIVFTFPSPVSHATPRSIPATSPAMSSRSGRSSGSGSSRGSKKDRSSQTSVQQLIHSLETHRVNTLTELCRIERVAATCDDEEDARAFQSPMTSAWDYYVSSNQFLTELRGLTRNYPIAGELVDEAQRQVRNDPESNRSWNLAWLCLIKMRDDGLTSSYAQAEAWKPEMWGGRDPTQEEADQLAQCFEHEWSKAVDKMLRHWSVAPTWY